MTTAYAERMGLRTGQTVVEIGRDDDTDPAIRDDIRRVTGSAPLDEGSGAARADAVLYWWREGDGDLASELTEAVEALSDEGAVWLLTPKPRHPGHTPAPDVIEAAGDADLHRTAEADLGAWTGHRLARRPADPHSP
ncbi:MULTISPECIES: DUF3052 family protein [Streptomyces]|nr:MULTISPECIES: DUF3052 family protein [Streptomyces]MCM1949348.1 DUF3052 domain-containing protein [Streptomyces sp. G2]